MYSCETVWVKVLVSKGWVQSKNYSTNTIMEKHKHKGSGGGKGYGIFRGIEEIASGFSRG